MDCSASVCTARKPLTSAADSAASTWTCARLEVASERSTAYKPASAKMSASDSAIDDARRRTALVDRCMTAGESAKVGMRRAGLATQLTQETRACKLRP